MGAFSEPSEAPEQRFWQNKLDISLKKLSRNQIEETKNGGKFEFQTFIAIFGRKLNENVENVISDSSQDGHLGI